MGDAKLIIGETQSPKHYFIFTNMEYKLNNLIHILDKNNGVKFLYMKNNLGQYPNNGK